MKERIIFIAAASALVLAAACSKQEASLSEQNQDSVIANPITISASLDEADTKATVSGEGTFAWTTGDIVAYHTTEGYQKSGGADASAATADFVIDGSKSRDAFAIYPHWLVWNTSTDAAYANSAADYGNGGPLVVNLPATYTLAQVSGNVSPCPMIATSNDASWHFYQLCSLLRLKINTIAPTANKIVIDFNGKKVSGAFSVASPAADGTSKIETNSGADSGDDTITITFAAAGGDTWTDNVVINLPLPILPAAATDTYGTITVTQKAGDTVLMTMEREIVSGGYSPARAGGRSIGSGFPVVSVSASQKVVFAPGILQATTNDYGANWTWGFASYLTNFSSGSQLKTGKTTKTQQEPKE